MNHQNKIKVLFIGGMGRSGSTLLDMILGRIKGFLSTGELKSVWYHGIRLKDLCSCGDFVVECSFWREVFNEAYGGFQKIDLDKILKLQKTVTSVRNIPYLISGLGLKKYTADLADYTSILGKLYKAIRKVTGSQVIVDSTKEPMYAFALQRMNEIDLRVIHLVRDSRAVGYSWQKKVLRNIRKTTNDYLDYLPRYSPIKGSIYWNVLNLLFHLFGIVYPERYTFLRYEDMVGNPENAIENIINLITNEYKDIEFLTEGVFEIRERHIIGGNPIRFNQGKVTVRLDQEWQEKMGESQKRIITMLTWPLLFKYGYLYKFRRGLH